MIHNDTVLNFLGQFYKHGILVCIHNNRCMLSYLNVWKTVLWKTSVLVLFIISASSTKIKLPSNLFFIHYINILTFSSPSQVFFGVFTRQELLHSEYGYINLP